VAATALPPAAQAADTAISGAAIPIMKRRYCIRELAFLDVLVLERRLASACLPAFLSGGACQRVCRDISGTLTAGSAGPAGSVYRRWPPRWR
jgi:hypothetical protein